jgi:hypothetical protein
MVDIVKRPSAIRLLLAILAIAGLVLSPIGRPLMAMPADMRTSLGDPMAMSDAAAMPADMPCCPDKSPGPDCGKDCPFMAFCAAKCFHSARLVSLFFPQRLVSIFVPGNEAELGSLVQAPPTRPPKI